MILTVLALFMLCLILQGVLLMDAINNLNAAVAELKITVDALVVPVNNDVAIQAAADGINAAVATLKSKVA